MARCLDRGDTLRDHEYRVGRACALAALVAVSACHSGHPARDAVSRVATVEVIAPLTIPAKRARAIFQDGRPVYAADPYRPSCELEISTVSEQSQQVGRDLFVVTRINTAILSDPDARLPIVGPFVDITCGDRIWYEVELRLASDRQPGVRHLRCRQAFNACWGRGGYPGRDVIRRALGPAFRVE